MKHLLVLFLLQLLTITLPSSITGEEAAQLVYDTEGHELSKDSQYYILRAGQKTGGLSNYRGDVMHHGPCSFFVGQSQSEEEEGVVPVSIKPSSSDGAVALSSNITIAFNVVTTCLESLHWYVTGSSPVPSPERHRYVATGKSTEGDLPRPASVFRIERYGDAKEGYKLVWCPHEGPCKDLGFYAFAETNWLVASGSPLAVVFKKAARA